MSQEVIILASVLLCSIAVVVALVIWKKVKPNDEPAEPFSERQGTFLKPRIVDDRVSRYYTLGISGESYKNSDGTSRQKIIKKCRIGESLDLIREPNNPHDKDAIAVIRKTGEQIGYLKDKDASWIAELIDGGREVEAEIEELMGGTSGKPSRGVLIRLSIMHS